MGLIADMVFFFRLEHLEKPILDVVPSVLFGALRPEVAVMTTPNADYNVLFPGFCGFRHHDHKFEWTQQEFKMWYVLQCWVDVCVCVHILLGAMECVKTMTTELNMEELGLLLLGEKVWDSAHR